MLYLIGGAPRCGKSSVAKQFATARCCSRVPTDYLGTAFSNYLAPTERQTRYPDWQTATVDERYERYSAAEVIANYRTKAATTWQGLRDFLIYALYDNHDLVVEGYHLEPAFVDELRTNYPQFQIQALFLCRTDIEQLQLDLQRSTDPQDWVLRSATQPVTFERVASMVCQYSALFQAEATTYGLPVCIMDGPFEQRIAQAVALLEEQYTPEG